MTFKDELDLAPEGVAYLGEDFVTIAAYTTSRTAEGLVLNREQATKLRDWLTEVLGK